MIKMTLNINCKMLRWQKNSFFECRLQKGVRLYLPVTQANRS